MSRVFGKPERDPELGEALRRIEASWPVSDDEALRRRILVAARPRLARLRTPAPRWWELLTGWTRVVVPVGLAASLAAGLLVRGSSANHTSYATDMGSDSTLVMAAFSEPFAGGQLAAELITPESNDWLLQQAISQ